MHTCLPPAPPQDALPVLLDGAPAGPVEPGGVRRQVLGQINISMLLPGRASDFGHRDIPKGSPLHGLPRVLRQLT